MAIGSPFGLEQTMTAGIISAKGRDLGERDHQLQRFLQTDAAINRGNSGGPLLNINGEVIGINTMIVSGSGNFEGIGFALPINLAVNSYNQIVKNGKVSRGAIGIQFAREENAGAAEGLRRIERRFRAAGDARRTGRQGWRAGFRRHRWQSMARPITRRRPTGANDLRGAARFDGRSESAARRQDHVEVPVKIGDRAAIVADNGVGNKRLRKATKREATTHARLGVSVQNLTRSDREQMGLKTGGVVIASVEPGSFAEDIGLQKGDVLVEINRHPVASAADVRNLDAIGQARRGDGFQGDAQYR